jgi:hypothetical protein
MSTEMEKMKEVKHKRAFPCKMIYIYKIVMVISWRSDGERELNESG